MITSLRRLLGRTGLAVSVALAAVGSLAAATPASAGAGCSAGYVGLTYDDGPTPDTTMALLGKLKEAGARATFYDVGQNAAANPELVRARLRAGMWVQNHSYAHPHMTQISDRDAFKEIVDTQTVLRKIKRAAPTQFRPPFGETDDRLRAQERRLGLLEVLWTVDSRDWAGATTEEIVAAADTLQPGGIILMHEWALPTIEAVPQIVARLAARGLCPGRIAYTPDEVPYGDTHFHAVAVRP